MPVPIFRPSIIDQRLLLNEGLSAEKLAGSHLTQATQFVLQYLETNGPIGLTKSGSFNRKFVTLAVETLQWPRYTPDELYRYNKVLNEVDVLPIAFLHDLLRGARIIRHQKGKALIAPLGRSISSNIGITQAVLFEKLFTDFDFEVYERWPSPIQDNDILHYIGVTQHRCREWLAFTDFAECCIPIPYLVHKGLATEEDCLFHVYGRVLRPLSWLGLMQERRASRLLSLEKMEVRCSPLLKSFVALDVDPMTSVRH